MQRIRHRIILCLVVIMGVIASGAGAQEAPPMMEVLISIADQKMAVLRDGGLLHKYPVSTSRFGIGDAFRSYKTPLGILRVCDKVGGELLPGSVIKHREATGEVLSVDAPGRDPIVTRILWLEGIEEQNRNAKARGIYIHGTPEEKNLGRPVSWGCIRMRSQDVIELYDEIGVGVEVNIIADKLPRYRKWEPPKATPIPVIIAAHTPAPAPVASSPTPRESRLASVPLSTPAPGRVVIATYNPPPKLTSTPAPSAATGGASHIVSVRWSEKPLSAVSAPIVETSSDGSHKKKKIYETEEGAFDAMHSSILFANIPDGRSATASASPSPTPGLSKPAGQ